MDFLIDFYKGLDTLNLIIFWGVIVVIILLLIFSITISNKNKKLKMIINSKEKNRKENNQEQIFPDEIALAVPKEEKTTEPENEPIIEKPINKEAEISVLTSKTIEEEKKFIAEEHVMEYDNNLFSISNIKKVDENQEEKINHNTKQTEIKMPTAPYQRNVLREMSLSQTSPIGIVKPDKKEDKIMTKAKELEVSLSEENSEEEIIERKTIKQEPTKSVDKKNIESSTNYQSEKNTHKENIEEIKNKDVLEIKSPKKEIYHEKETISIDPPRKETSIEVKPNNQSHPKIDNYFKISEEKNHEMKTDSYLETNLTDIEKTTSHIKKNIINDREVPKKDSYLEEVSKKLAVAEKTEDIDRTEYELKQEEEAIISYEELMQKKDTIKIIDEEEAVISIEELLRKKEQEDKLYNLTEDEENDKFINELKNFRNDL